MEHIGNLDQDLVEMRALLNAIEVTDVYYRIIRHLKELAKLAKQAQINLKARGYIE